MTLELKLAFHAQTIFKSYRRNIASEFSYAVKLGYNELYGTAIICSLYRYNRDRYNRVRLYIY